MREKKERCIFQILAHIYSNNNNDKNVCIGELLLATPNGYYAHNNFFLLHVYMSI